MSELNFVSQCQNETLCFDIGGTNIKYAIFNNSKKTLSRVETVKTKKNKERFFSQLNEITAKKNSSKVAIAFPGNIDTKGNILFSPNLNFLEGTNFAEQLKDNLTVKIENDANCAAIAGSKIFSEYSDIITITLGTGIGGGVVLNGKLVNNSRKTGFEFGHVTVKTNGEICSCGKSGCVEAYSSSRGMIAAYNKLNPKSPINGFEIKELYDKFQLGDKLAKQAIKNGFFYLGVACSIYMNIFSPQLFLFTGGISNIFEIFEKDFKKGFSENTINFLKNKTSFATYTKNNLGLIGAGYLFD